VLLTQPENLGAGQADHTAKDHTAKDHTANNNTAQIDTINNHTHQTHTHTNQTHTHTHQINTAQTQTDTDELAEIFAEQLLRRWGIVFRDLFVLENCSLPWREVLWALRRLEARGIILGGRFVSGFVGEQFALPAAADELRFVSRQPRTAEKVTINATDPLNLTGILTGTERIPALHTRQVSYVDGFPVDDCSPASAPNGFATAQTAQAGAAVKLK